MYLYLLSEGARDAVLYECLAERVSGRSFQLDLEFAYQPGDNWGTVFGLARLLLDRVRHWPAGQEIAIIIAVDNDRAPGHPAGRNYSRPLPAHDQKKNSRWADLQKLLADRLGADRAAWPVQVAVAMPVEMIESWLLVLLNPACSEPPPFAEAAQFIARQYYGGNAPPQLKDIVAAEAVDRGITKADLFLTAPGGDLDAAAAASPSLSLFLDEVREWRIS